MTTTELITLLKSVEHGASGRSREINIMVDGDYIFDPQFTIVGSGDGCLGAELILKMVKNEVLEG